MNEALNEADLMTAIKDLEDQGIVSVCLTCEEKVHVLICPHGSEMSFHRDGTPHRACDPNPVIVGLGPVAYGGYSGPELLEQLRQQGARW